MDRRVLAIFPPSMTAAAAVCLSGITAELLWEKIGKVFQFSPWVEAASSEAVLEKFLYEETAASFYMKVSNSANVCHLNSKRHYNT